MRNFNQGKRFGGNKKSGGRDFGGRNAGKPSMFKATCADCGETCEVPFKPSGDRPVYCSDCFEGGERGNNGPKRSGRRDFERPSFGEKQMYKATCAECGGRCEVPFRPSGDKPVYCSECFKGGKSGGGKGERNDGKQWESQFAAINAKIDKILAVLAPVRVITKELAPKKEEKAKKEAANPKKEAGATEKPKEKKAVTKKASAKKPAAKKAGTKKKK